MCIVWFVLRFTPLGSFDHFIFGTPCASSASRPVQICTDLVDASVCVVGVGKKCKRCKRCKRCGAHRIQSDAFFLWTIAALIIMIVAHDSF